MSESSSAPLYAPIPRQRPLLGRIRHQADPIILLGNPYDDGAHDRTSTVDMPALGKALARLGQTITISEARNLPENRPVDAEGRRLIIDQASVVLGELYVHRYLKHAKHAYDPVAALRQLRRRAEKLSAFEFHLGVMRIFKQLRDIHTGYILPRPYSEMVAFLPFILAAYRPGIAGRAHTAAEMAAEEDGGIDRRVVVQSLLADFHHPHFVPGVEVLSWNGLPVQEAVLQIGTEEQGSNIHAQFALGLRLMTVRWLGGSLPPNEYFATIFYRDRDGEPREIRFPWRVMRGAADSERIASIQAMWDVQRKFASGVAEDPSVDPRSLIEDAVRSNLYHAPEAMTDEGAVRREPVVLEDLPEGIFDLSRVVVRAPDGGREFGLVRIRSFFCPEGPFLEAFVRVLNAMPKSGLVVDIRSNPGGFVRSAEVILQTMTAQPITPLPFQFLATQLVEELVGSHKSAACELREWQERVIPAVSIGNQFSRFGTLTDPRSANAIGQRYYGPVVLVTDAVTYSSGDIFAAGFQDNGIGRVIGVDLTTGGGGANMWTHRTCVNMAEDGGQLKVLPGGAVSGAKMHYAVRRCTRVGRNMGAIVEEEGVRCDDFHALTRNDLLGQDVDLLQFAAGVLRKQPTPRYEVRLSCDGAAIDMDTLEAVADAAGDVSEIVARIETEPATDPVSHVLELDGVAQGVVHSRGGCAEIGVSCPTAGPAEISIASFRVNPASGRSIETLGRMKRRVSFRRCDA